MREFKLAAIQRLKMGASATEVARAFEVNPNVLHRWWREFHLRPGNAWASGLDDPGGRTTRCLLETDMTRKDREAMSERPLDPVRRNFLSAAGAFGAKEFSCGTAGFWL